MSKIIDYLQEIDLLDYQKSDDYFFTSDIDIINTLVDHISMLIAEDWVISEYSPYSFSPSLNISGFEALSACQKNRKVSTCRFFH